MKPVIQGPLSCRVTDLTAELVAAGFRAVFGKATDGTD